MLKVNSFLEYSRALFGVSREQGKKVMNLNRSKAARRITIFLLPLMPIFIGLMICLPTLLIAGSLYARDYQIYTPKTLVFSKWGLAPQDFGLREGNEIEPFGASTFALDRKANIYILDSIKGHIKKFNQEGVFLGNIGDKIRGSDVAVNANSHVFVLDGQVAREYSSSGDMLDQYSISNDIKLIEGYGQGMIIDDFGNLYVKRLQETYQIGLGIDGKTKPLEAGNQLLTKRAGLPNITKKRRFKTKWENKHKAEVRIFDDKGNVPKEISMNTYDIFGSVLFLKEDKEGFIYIENERITSDNYVHLEVRKYDMEGNLVSIIELPNDYYTTAYKKIDVDEDGNIYQLVTIPEGVKLIKWEHK